MANLDRIANVQISLRTTAITERSFSDMLIFGAHMLTPLRTFVVTSPGDLIDMGLSDADPLYLAVRDAFSAIPAVRQVYVGRQQVDSAVVTVTSAGTSVYTIFLQWRDATGMIQSGTVSYTGNPEDGEEDIAEGLATALDGSAAPVTGSASANTVTVTNTVAGTPLGVSVAGNLTMAIGPSAESVGAALTAVNNEMNNWYGLVLTSRLEADVLAAAAWVEANEKLFLTSSDDAGILDPGSTTDLASLLKQNQYFRSAAMYSANADTQYPEATWMSNRFTYYPGQETWAMVRLPGIAYDNLQEGQAIAAHGKNASTFEPFRNFAITQGGRVAAGEWIDVIRLRDQLVDQIKVSVVSAMINADGKGKVPYTDDGIQITGNAVRGPLDLNVRRGGLAPQEVDGDGNLIPSYTLELPRSFEIPANDKANRILRDVRFSARLAGAIHVVEIQGSLTYVL